MWFWKKKEVSEKKQNLTLTASPPKEKKLRFSIDILQKDGSYIGYHLILPIDTKVTCIQCFYKFYKWFYFRDSEYYTYKHKDGIDIFIRSQIKLIKIRKTEIEVEI